MSTIQVNAIQSSSGTQEVTQTTLFSGTAKVSLKFSSAAADVGSFNISSTSDDGTGSYSCTYSIALSITEGGGAVARSTGDRIAAVNYSSGSATINMYEISPFSLLDQQGAFVVFGDLT